MSFASQRTARQRKELRSYVTKASSPPLKESDPVNNVVSSTDLYKPLPSSMEIRTSTTRGRGIWVKEKFTAGSVLLSLKPHVAVLSSQYLDSHCSSCFGTAPASRLRRCTQCRTIWYCNSECQTNDWPMHKHECSALQEWAKTSPPKQAIPSDATRCQGRMLWKMRKQGPGSVWSKEIHNMQSHRSSLPPSAHEHHIHLAHAITHYLRLSSPVEREEFGFASAADLVDFTSRFATNTFTLTGPSLTPIGISVSPLVALINHSCEPNAVVVFPRFTTSKSFMQVVALQNISSNEEILTSYIDTTTSRETRQQSLQETYSFSCDCTLCTTPPCPDLRESMWCPKACGGVCPVPTNDTSSTQCTKCNTPISDIVAVVDILRVGKVALEKATSLQFNDPAEAKRLTSHMVPILTAAGLIPSSYPLLAMIRLHQALLISSLAEGVTHDELDEIIRIVAKSVAGLSNALCYGHPVRGVALAELGKILAVDEPAPPSNAGKVQQASFPPSGPARVKLAYETLLRARNELLIGFGVTNNGGQVGSEVREMLVSLETELGIWNQGVRNVVEHTLT